MATTLLDVGIAIGVVAGFVLIIWSRMTHQTITEVIISIKEMFGAVKGEK